MEVKRLLLSLFFIGILLIGATQILAKPVTEEGFKKCPEKRPEICTMIYQPVCAKMVINGKVVWKTFSNWCVACQNRYVVGYKPGPCEKEIIKNISKQKGRLFIIKDHMLEKIKELKLVIDNKTIEVKHEIYKNETTLIINKEIKVTIDGKVVVDKEHKKIIIIRGNVSVPIESKVLEVISKYKEEMRRHLLKELRGKLKTIKDYNNLLERLNKTKANITIDKETGNIILRAKLPAKVKILFIFTVPMEIEVEEAIDPNTGIYFVYVKKPWWWFLVTRVNILP